MLAVLEVTLPVFALILCGHVAAGRRLLPEMAVEGINAFVFWFALPAMLFRVVAQRYRVPTDAISAATAVGTVLSVLSITVTICLLGLR